MPRLTQVAHKLLATVLSAGDLAIDATAGNGHDTRFLAERVAPGGQVLAIDRQASALENTAARLGIGSYAESTSLLCGDHAELLQLAPQHWQGQVRAIVFNLGYLPGSDKSIVTAPETTRMALDASLKLLAPNGLLSVLIYRGHDGGHAEEAMMEAWLVENADQLCNTEWNDGDHPTDTSPRLMTTYRRNSVDEARNWAKRN